MNAAKFYIRFREDFPETEMQAAALYGFRQRGVETAPFYWGDDIAGLDDLGPDVGLAGYIEDVWKALDKVGARRPPSLDYPQALRSFLGRELWRSDLKTVRGITHRKLFVKPVKQKLFTGFQMTGAFNDQIRMGTYHETEEVWLSDPVDFVSEYRCFVLRGEVLSARWYKGDWGVAIDRKVVEAAAKAWPEAPVAYTLDFGATKDGKTLLVEVNDGFAMGTYGLQPELYAAMLEARWQEMVRGDGPHEE